MSDQTERTIPLLSRFDILTMVGAIVMLFIATGAEPWWTLNGATNSRLFNIKISPFYVQISATGLPATVPFANSLGTVTRILLLLGFFALFIASLRPMAWYHNLALYVGVSSLAELYLSFTLMLYWVQTAFVSAYGIAPPFYGTAHYAVNILGLDLNLYPTPFVAATFYTPYYLGFISIILVTGRALLKILRERASQTLSLLAGGIHDVFMSPPYQRVWFSSGDKQYNPLMTDPGSQSDDKLLASFENLYKTVEPGGTLSIIIPMWAASLNDRLVKLMPQVGFAVEESESVFRIPGRQETELRFRKQLSEPTPLTEQEQIQDPPELAHEQTEIPPTISRVIEKVPDEPTLPTIMESIPEPAWTQHGLTRLERSILKIAVKILTDRKQPVQYREFLNQVYMELVDHKVEFDSARQIEATLLTHNGSEIQLTEEDVADGQPIQKKWMLGPRKMNTGHVTMPILEVVQDKKTKIRFGEIFKRRKKSRYKPKSSGDEDTAS